MMTDARLRELYEIEGIDAVKRELKEELEEVRSEKGRWDNERFSWHFNFAGMILACVIMLCGVGGCMNAEGRESDAVGKMAMAEARLKAARQDKVDLLQQKEERLKQYRIFLLENKIDPDTGKPWKGK
jgi:hypothetical protein